MGFSGDGPDAQYD